MPERWVLVHDCRTSPETDRREDGLPSACDCVRRIATRDARELVARGDATWKLRRVGDHRPPVEDRSELILLKARHNTHAHSISQYDIRRAYVDVDDRNNGRRDRARIEAYGAMALAALAALQKGSDDENSES